MQAKESAISVATSLIAVIFWSFVDIGVGGADGVTTGFSTDWVTCIWGCSCSAGAITSFVITAVATVAATALSVFVVTDCLDSSVFVSGLTSSIVYSTLAPFVSDVNLLS